MRISVRVDVKDMTGGLDLLRKKAPSAIWRALDRAATSGRAFMSQQIVADTGLAAKYVKREIVIEKGKEHARLLVKGYRLPLIAFSARGPRPSRGRGRGVSYKLPGSAGRIPNAFIATMPNPGPESNWHEGVFKRATTKRLPIRQLYGPSLPHVFVKYLDDGAAHAEQELRKNLAHEMDFLLKR